MIIRRLEVLIVLATVVFCGCESRNEKARPEPASQGDSQTKPVATQPASAPDRIGANGSGELIATEWTTSGDGVLSLRLLALKTQPLVSQKVALMAELRNDSNKDQMVLRPLADPQRVKTDMLSIRNTKRLVQFIGPVSGYGLGVDAYMVLKSGQTIRDRIELLAASFKGMDVPGEYILAFKYSVRVDDRPMNPKLFPEDTRTPWTGEFSTKELRIVLKPPK